MSAYGFEYGASEYNGDNDPRGGDEGIELITFTNYDPRVHDGLGEIQWQAPALCDECGSTQDFSLRSTLYDGCLRESPTCNNCGADLLGLPTDPQARALVEAQRVGRGGK